MLNSARKRMKLSSIVRTQNEYKEWIAEEKPLGDIDCSIALLANNPFNQNSLKLKDCSFIGFTNSTKPQPGMKLDTYLIEWVLPMGTELVLYLKEIQNG